MTKQLRYFIAGILAAIALGALAQISGLPIHTHAGASSGGSIAASQASVDAGTSTTVYLTPERKRITLATQQASTSGTSIDFTGIPAGTRRITMMLNAVSTSSTSAYIVQIGDSGGVETTGYVAGVGHRGAEATSTAGCILHTVATAAGSNHAVVTLTLMDAASFTWSGHSNLILASTGAPQVGACSKSLSAELDRVRLTTAGGVDTFDAGTVNVAYER